MSSEKKPTKSEIRAAHREAKKKDFVTRVLRVKVIKPLDGDWDTLGKALRALEKPLHLVLNNTVNRLELAYARDRERALFQGLEPEKGTQHGRAYRFAVEEWERQVELATQRLAEETEASTQGDDKRKKKCYDWDADVVAFPPMRSSVIHGCSGHAFTQWSLYNKERLRGGRRLGGFSANCPISLTTGTSHEYVSIEARDGNAVLWVRLCKDYHPGLIVSLGRKRASQKSILKAILEKPDRLRSVKLVHVHDRHSRKWQWEAHIAYHSPRPQIEDKPRLATIARGMHSFITVSVARSSQSARDAWTRVLETGDDIIAHKRAYFSRRKSRAPRPVPWARLQRARGESPLRASDAHRRGRTQMGS